MRSKTSPERSSALVGMQPQLRQMPPRCSRSTRPVFIPSWAARMAATYPPGPPPTTTISNFCAMGSLSFCFGSIRVGYWDRPCGGQEPGSRGTRLGRPLERSSPAEIVWEITRGDAVEAAHPALQPAVVGVHVLDVEGPVADADAGRDVDRLVADAALGGEGGVGLSTIRAQHGIAGDDRPERCPDGLSPKVGQHGIGGVAGAVAGDQRRDPLGREAAFARPLAAPARPSLGRG